MKHILKYYLPIFAITLCSIYSCTSTNEGISNTVKMKFHESSIIATDFSDSFNSIKPESATNDAIITNIATQTGIREQNRVKTKYIFTKDDLIFYDQFSKLCYNRHFSK